MTRHRHAIQDMEGQRILCKMRNKKIEAGKGAYITTEIRRDDAMFLSKLSPKKKELFLELCLHAAMTNNLVEDEERMIAEYCNEMGLGPRIKMEPSMEIEDVLNNIIQVCDEKEIRIFSFEILGLLLSDKAYDEVEISFVEMLKTSFRLSDELIDKMLRQLHGFNVLFDEICETVLNPIADEV